MSVTFLLKREQLDDVRERVFIQIDKIIQHTITALLDDKGLVFGEVELEREERVLKVVDLSQRGVLEALRQIAPAENPEQVKPISLAAYPPRSGKFRLPTPSPIRRSRVRNQASLPPVLGSSVDVSTKSAYGVS